MDEYYPTNVLKIPNATPDTKDAAQYMFYKGKKQFNLCGELCVAYCMQDEANTNDIDSFLSYWEAKDLKWYQTLFNNGLARTTSIYDLQKMLIPYWSINYPPPFNLAAIATTSLRYSYQLINYQAIIGVQIDNYGYLVGKGIPHWVVLDKVNVIDNQHAICSIYNPYTNAIEPYTWRELMNSTGSYKQGLWIER